MILYDFSSSLHRNLHTALNASKPKKVDGKFVISDFIGYAIHRVFNEMFTFFKNYRSEYGEFVVCMDDHTKKYWRKEIYPDYKANRTYDNNDIDMKEAFKHFEVLEFVVKNYLPFKAINVAGVEADDIIGVLTRKYAKTEKILILSPDKDFKQLHDKGDVKQYSSLTNEWIQISNEELKKWKLIHVCLGDASDNVPRITDFSVFSENFKKHFNNYISQNGLQINCDELTYYNLDDSLKKKILNEYNIYKKNKKGENTILDVFDNPKIGEASLLRSIEKHGGLDNFLDSNEIYRLNYERNKKLVLDDEIPAKIEAQILSNYNDCEQNFNLNELNKYCDYYNLNKIKMDLKNLESVFVKPMKLTIFNANFDNI